MAALRHAAAALVVILLSTYFVSMALGLFLFYVVPQGLDAASGHIAELSLSAFMIINFRIPLGISIGFFFLVIWLLYLGAFAYAWFDKPTFPSSLRIFLTRLDAIRANYLVVLPQLASVVLVVVVLLQTLQESAGIQTGGISFESPVVGFVAVSYAPLVEEFSYRITTIGLLDWVDLLRKRSPLPPNERGKGAFHLLLLTMWKPERAKELLGFNTIRNSGVRRGLSRFEWLVLILTSGAFGAVHYLSGGGWQIGKISTAMLSGLAMGFVYLRYGAFAPVLLHWFFNYYLGVFDLASQLNLSGFGSAGLVVQLLNFGAGTLLAAVLLVGTLRRAWSLSHSRT
jgi:hypothetical protein